MKSRGGMFAMTEADISRFWSHVAVVDDADSCWLWRAGVHARTGYGHFKLHGRTVLPHRVARFLLCGPIPGGALVLHSCDVRHCCRMDLHGFLGDDAVNAADRDAKERQTRGQGVHSCKLTPDDVRAIRSASAAGATQVALAARYGVNHTNIGFIIRGRTWAWLDAGLRA